jgi:hypothetical protein
MVLSEVFWHETVLISFETGHARVAQASHIDSFYQEFQMGDRARERFVSDHRSIVCSSNGTVLMD